MKQQYPYWEYVISLPVLGWGLKSFYEEKSRNEAHKYSAASKRRISLGRFSKGIRGCRRIKKFCGGGILPGFRAEKSATAVKLCLPDGAVRLLVGSRDHPQNIRGSLL